MQGTPRQGLSALAGDNVPPRRRLEETYCGMEEILQQGSILLNGFQGGAWTVGHVLPTRQGHGAREYLGIVRLRPLV